jgi:hypothetical protein
MSQPPGAGRAISGPTAVMRKRSAPQVHKAAPLMRQRGSSEGGTPSRQRRVSSLRKRNTGREGTASRELKPVSASRAQSFYAPGSIHLGSLPPCPDHAKDPPGIARQSSGDDRGGGRQQQDAPAPVSQPYEEAECDENAEKSHVSDLF